MESMQTIYNPDIDLQIEALEVLLLAYAYTSRLSMANVTNHSCSLKKDCLRIACYCKYDNLRVE